MKYLLLPGALAASLLLSIPAGAADETPAPPAAPADPMAVLHQSELWINFIAPLSEMKPLLMEKQRPDVQLDRFAQFEFSTDAKQKFMKLFGNERPLRVERRAGAHGGTDYVLTLDKLSLLDPTGGKTDWSAASATFAFDKTHHAMTTNGAWPLLSFGGTDARFDIENIKLNGKTRLGPDDLWLGKYRFTVERVKVAVNPSGAGVTFKDWAVQTDTSAHGKLFNIAYGTSIRSVEFGKDKIDAIKLSMKLVNLDRDSMTQLGKQIVKINQEAKAATTPQEQLAQATPLLRQIGKSLMGHGTALDITDFSASYHGFKAALSGKIEIQGTQDDDVSTLALFGRRLAAHFELRAPLGLVTEIAHAVARAVAKGNDGQAASEQAVNQLAQTFYDSSMGGLYAAHLVRLEKGVLRSSIDLKDGKLSVNGKEMNPSPININVGHPAAPAAAPSSTSAANAAAVLPASGCPAPDYPAEARRLGQGGTVQVHSLVGADGRILERSIQKSSGRPLLDHAMLDALDHCRVATPAAGEIPVQRWITEEYTFRLQK